MLFFLFCILVDQPMGGGGNNPPAYATESYYDL